ncbi:spermatogenesis-associated protein 20 isoform X2 [Anabrus simplex]|uniref:spermatogenesis-associated protein 20 isoform X2 n=1 Tax=Anabrus simplex TaxID=316456 RepID=UPI0034DD7C19
MISGRLIPCPIVLSLVRRVTSESNVNSGVLAAGVSDNKQLFYTKKLELTTPNLSKTMATGGETLTSKHQNRLATEKSPYLLQHASNPVEWYPWGEEAFEKARKEDKLIFLSVGYSTCHWCHVMEHESFENEEIAKVMNENFVNIKVDREERPDVDRMYMMFVQATTSGGGWPMSVWLTPDLTPVYGGTYFPPDDRYYGRPGFKSLLEIIKTQWRENRQKFAESGAKITEVLRMTAAVSPSATVPGKECADKCSQQLAQNFEPNFGGFGDAPKFPQPCNLNFLFHVYSRSPTSEAGKKALEMCVYTLKMMAKGGIHDHISQGFARYSTDDRWHVPHFEKMLYDQAQLAVAYSTAYVATKDAFFAEIVRDILTYVDRDLSDKAGGFYSAEDADSYPSHDAKMKREGAFCVWTYDEVQQLLSKPVEGHDSVTLADVFCFHYDVKPQGNVNPYQDPHHELKNQNVLIVLGSEEATAEHFKLDLQLTRTVLKECQEILYEVRQKRPRPHLDDKILTCWNGLMISGFSKAGQALQDNSYIQRAIKAADFIKRHLYNPTAESLLRSCYRNSDGTIVQTATPIPGFLDDYAFLIQGLLDLYESCFDPSWLEWAETLQDQQDRLFWDEQAGGYFTSSADDTSILIRIKEDQDGAEPSGNSVSARNLQRLAAYLNRGELHMKATRLLGAFTNRLTRLPISLPEMCSALLLYHDSPTQVFVTGRMEDADTAALLAVVQERLIPGRVLALADGRDAGESILYRKCDVIRRMKPLGGRAAAYVCRNQTCSLPVNTSGDLAALLDQKD